MSIHGRIFHYRTYSIVFSFVIFSLINAALATAATTVAKETVATDHLTEIQEDFYPQITIRNLTEFDQLALIKTKINESSEFKVIEEKLEHSQITFAIIQTTAKDSKSQTGMTDLNSKDRVLDYLKSLEFSKNFKVQFQKIDDQKWLGDLL